MQDVALLLCVASWGARIKAIGRLQIVYSARVFSGQIKPAIISSLKLVIQPLGWLSWNAQECLIWFGDWWRVSFATPAHSDSSYFYLVLQLCADYGFGGLKFLKKLIFDWHFYTCFINYPLHEFVESKKSIWNSCSKTKWSSKFFSSSKVQSGKICRSGVVALNILCLLSLQWALSSIMKSNLRANRASPFRYLKM